MCKDLVMSELTASVPEYPNSFYLTEFFQTMMYGEAFGQIEFDRPWGTTPGE